MEVKNDLYDYKNRYIYQDSDFFKFSLDSILLAEFTRVMKENSKVLDMCSGNMAIPLICSTFNDSNYVGFEVSKPIYDLAIKSIRINNIKNMLVYNDDIKNIGNYFQKGTFDYITCNPPYFKVNTKSYTNLNAVKALARHEILINMENIFSIACDYLKSNGVFFMVHRCNRLDEIISLGIKYNLRVKEIQLISTKANLAPTIVLVKCVKNSKENLKINHEICIENRRTYKKIFEEKV